LRAGIRTLGLDGQAARAGGGAQEVTEGLADGCLAGDMVPGELRQGGVVGLDELRAWFEFQCRHGMLLV